jgi:hypothetical protein
MTAIAPLGRRTAVEFAGTGALVAVIGSGIQATQLSSDVGVRLLANSLAMVFGLAVLIVLLGPVSGAHFNPVVLDWKLDDPAGQGVDAVRPIRGQIAQRVRGLLTEPHIEPAA